MKLASKAFAAGVVLFMICSCASVPVEPPAPGELRLLSMSLPEPIRANIHHPVTVKFEAGGDPEIKRACFYLSGDGPYCFKVTDVHYGPPGSFTVMFRSTRRGSYQIECYAEYIRDGRTWPTKLISSQITVIY